MKRLIVCLDGTWSRLDARWPTNVTKFALSLAERSQDGVSQLVWYDDGVGTGAPVAGRLDRWMGGAFGRGVLLSDRGGLSVSWSSIIRPVMKSI